MSKSKRLPIEVWRTPTIDNIPTKLWYAEDVIVTKDPCPKLVCKHCGSEPGSQTLKIGQNWIYCKGRHLIGTDDPEADNTPEEMKRTYKIIGIYHKGEVLT